MIEQVEQTALEQERHRLRGALTQLHGLQRPPRETPVPALEPPPPTRPLFEYVPVSYLESVDWDRANEAPAPPGASQFDFLLAPLPRRTADVGLIEESTPTSSFPFPNQRASQAETSLPDPPIERAGGFFQQFDWQDPLEGGEERATVPLGTEATHGESSADIALEFDDFQSAEEKMATRGKEQPATTGDPDRMPTTDAVFGEFSWE